MRLPLSTCPESLSVWKKVRVENLSSTVSRRTSSGRVGRRGSTALKDGSNNRSQVLPLRVYSSECRNIISCRKFWHGAKTLAQNFGKEKLAKTFGMEFHAEIPCRNSEPKYKHRAKTFGTKFRHRKTCRNFRLKNHAKISCRKNRLEMAFRRTDV